MSRTADFNFATEVADDQTQAQLEFKAIVKYHNSFGYDPFNFQSLERVLETQPLAKLGLADSLKGVMQVLQDPEDAKSVRLAKPVPPLPGRAFRESAGLTTEQEDHLKQETFHQLQKARDALQFELLGVTVGKRMGFSHASNEAFDWVAENLKGGKTIRDAIPAIAKSLFIVGYHVERGATLEDAVSVALGEQKANHKASPKNDKI